MQTIQKLYQRFTISCLHNIIKEAKRKYRFQNEPVQADKEIGGIRTTDAS
jgi:hypothetical protein